MVDTGAVVSIMLPLAAGLRTEIRTWGGPPTVMVNGQKKPPMGKVSVKVKIGAAKVTAEILVLELSVIELLLGKRRAEKVQEI